jgi:hypothetical protein
VEDDDPTAEAAETITPDELDDLLDDGTPTRVVVLRQPGSGFAVASVTFALATSWSPLSSVAVDFDRASRRASMASSAVRACFSSASAASSFFTLWWEINVPF